MTEPLTPPLPPDCRWTVLGPGQKRYTWLVQCSCGSPPRDVHLHNILRGLSRSCGCYSRELGRKGGGNHKHGCCGTAEYQAWSNLKNHNPDRVCPRWRASFPDFLADVGPKPSPHHRLCLLQHGNYEPGNVAWMPPGWGTRGHKSTWLSYSGQTKCVAGWARELGITRQALQQRLKRKSLEEIIESHAQAQAQTQGGG